MFYSEKIDLRRAAGVTPVLRRMRRLCCAANLGADTPVGKAAFLSGISTTARSRPFWLRAVPTIFPLLYVVYGNDINSSGKIVGTALNQKGLERAVVLIPDKKAAVLPTGVSAPKFAAQQSLRIQLRSTGVTPAALRKSIFSL